MIEVFDEKDVEECLSEVKDSNIKTYAFCLLDWAVQKRKVKAIPLDKVKQAREEIAKGLLGLDSWYEVDRAKIRQIKKDLEILDKLIAESEG